MPTDTHFAVKSLSPHAQTPIFSELRRTGANTTDIVQFFVASPNPLDYPSFSSVGSRDIKTSPQLGSSRSFSYFEIHSTLLASVFWATWTLFFVQNLIAVRAWARLGSPSCISCECVNTYSWRKHDYSNFKPLWSSPTSPFHTFKSELLAVLTWIFLVVLDTVLSSKLAGAFSPP